MDTFITELTGALQNAVPLFIAYSIIPAWVATIIVPLLIILLRHGFKNARWSGKMTYETVSISETARFNANGYYIAVSYYLIHTAKIRSDDILEVGLNTMTGSSSYITNVAKIERQSFVYDKCKIYVYSESKETQLSGTQRVIHLQSERKADIFRFAEHALKQYIFLKNKDSIGEHHYNDGAVWNTSPMYVAKTFDNIYLDPKLHQHLIKEIDGFLESEQFYRDRGIAYRRGYLMYGPHGCGKTSVINAIANRTDFGVRTLHLGRIKDGGMLRKVIQGIPPSSIVVLEDLDCLSVSHKRKRVKLTSEAVTFIINEINTTGQCECVAMRDRFLNSPDRNALFENPESVVLEFQDYLDSDPTNGLIFIKRIQLEEKVPGGYKEVESSKDGGDSLTLADLLEILDSNTFLYKTIVIITSNHPDKFDPALVRPGRIDMNFEFLPAGEALVHKILKSFYPELPDELLPKMNNTIPQSTLINSIIIPNRKDYTGALKALSSMLSN